MKLIIKSFAKGYSCPSCGHKVKRMYLTFVEDAFLRILFYACYAIAFLIVGFIVQISGGSHFMASMLSLFIVTSVAVPVYFSFSVFRCNSCDKQFKFSEVKSHGWF